ncbi:hypothetical protein L7F22_033935 [Adiantum nelumboides]|nr:hypothetical protein [Adiantum nelumboides]MCO5580069.1 hypothetical protein [Adiantum nelumboides]
MASKRKKSTLESLLEKGVARRFVLENMLDEELLEMCGYRAQAETSELQPKQAECNVQMDRLQDELCNVQREIKELVDKVPVGEARLQAGPNSDYFCQVKALAAPSSLCRREYGEHQLFKYCKRYGKEVHQVWAEVGLAPKLFAYKSIVGGWFAIEMEYLSEADGWKSIYQCSNSVQDSGLQRAIEDALRKTLNLNKDLAHGDMRAPKHHGGKKRSNSI